MFVTRCLYFKHCGSLNVLKILCIVTKSLPMAWSILPIRLFPSTLSCMYGPPILDVYVVKSLSFRNYLFFPTRKKSNLYFISSTFYQTSNGVFSDVTQTKATQAGVSIRSFGPHCLSNPLSENTIKITLPFSRD